MKYLFIITIILDLFFLSLSVIQNWDLEKSSIDLLASANANSVTKSYGGSEYNIYFELKKTIEKLSNGTIIYKKYLTMYKPNTDNKIYDGEVDFDDVESFYYLNNKYIICPRGKHRPLQFDWGNSKEILDTPGFVEKGDWVLRCYNHKVGFLLVFYLMNGDNHFYRTRTDGSFNWVRETFYSEVYDFKINNGNEGENYPGALIILDNGNIILKGINFIIKNDGMWRTDGSRNNILLNALTKSRGTFDKTYDHFYFLTYTDADNFYSGYFNSANNIDYLKDEEISFNQFLDSPLQFIDKVEIKEIKFIHSYKFAYYVIDNPSNKKTYRGIIDITKNLVVFIRMKKF